jgi:hypothetical protein
LLIFCIRSQHHFSVNFLATMISWKHDALIMMTILLRSIYLLQYIWIHPERLLPGTWHRRWGGKDVVATG